MKKLFFFFFLSLSALAQIHEVAEVSMILPNDVEEDIQLLAVNEEELLLINLQEDYLRKTDKNLNVVKFDSDLKQKWLVSIPIERTRIPINYRAANDKMYYLVSIPETKKLELITIELSNGQWSKHAFETLTKLINTDFEVFNGYILVSGEYNQKPVVEMHSVSLNAAKVLPELHYKNTLLKGMYVNPYRNQLYVISLLSTKCQLTAMIYDETGKLLSKHILGDKKHKLSNVLMRFLTDGEPFVLGTYNAVCNDIVAGFFSGSLDHPAKLNYVDISNLPSYTSTLSSKKQERRILRKEKGKPNIARQRVLFSVPFSGERGYVASGEIYTQQTISGPARTSQIENSGRRITVPTIYEYRISRLLLAELGFDGKVNQDNLAKLDGRSFNFLKPQTGYLFKNDNFYGILPGKKDLSYLNMSETNSAVQSYSLFADSKFKVSDVDVEVLNWGSNAVLAYGVANLEFSREQYTSTRQLFYIKKLEVK